MTRVIGLFLLGPILLIGPPAMASESLEKLQESYDAAMEKWFEDGKYDLETHPVKTFYPKFRAYADEHARTPKAVPAILWILENGSYAQPGPKEAEKIISWSLDTLKSDHVSALSEEDLGRMTHLFYAVNLKRLDAFYAAILAAPQKTEVKAHATFNLACALSSDFARRDDDGDAKADRKRAKSLFYKVRKEFAGTAAAKMAVPYIYEIENLQVGHKAPDIVGKDPDGKEIKLSQFSGQVVVLDFWGFW